jgi:uncharacterized cupredoxin-like copper-binding protein
MGAPPKTPMPDPLERELHELEHEEERLEERTSSVERLNILTLLLALIALGASMAAIALAVSNDDNGSTGPLMGSGSNSSAMSGGAMMGSASGGQPAPAGVHTVRVKLGEMWVRPQYTSVQAGKVTFVAQNVGKVEHELMVERAPIAMDGPGRPTEEAAQGMIEDMEPGEGGQMTLKLKPGGYVLFCNVPGHYAAGQHVRFTVTGS